VGLALGLTLWILFNIAVVAGLTLFARSRRAQRLRAEAGRAPQEPVDVQGYSALLLPRLCVQIARVSGARHVGVIVREPWDDGSYVCVAEHGLDESIIGLRLSGPGAVGELGLGRCAAFALGDNGYLCVTPALGARFAAADLALLSWFAERCSDALEDLSRASELDVAIERSVELLCAEDGPLAGGGFASLVSSIGSRLGLDAVAALELELAARIAYASPASAGAVAGLPGMECVAVLLRFARERWDGSGPDRLRGERIPLGSRVLAGCVGFASEPEGYRSRRGGDRVLRAAQATSGTELDPAVVAALSEEMLGPPWLLDEPEILAAGPPWANDDRLYPSAFAFA
jgi:hypothetical protein